MLAFAQLGLRPGPLSLVPRSPLRALRRRLSTRAPAVTMEERGSGIKRKQVAAVIIGNEILNGKTTDTNLGMLARHVEDHGAVLARAATIRDEVDEIARVVAALSRDHDLVFTSGGIGPTLDDVTYAGVAAAFGRTTAVHDGTVERMREIQPEMTLNDARLRMATLPTPLDEALWTDGLWVPLAVVRNVYVLPGIPSLFARMLRSVPPRRFGDAARRARAVVLCETREGDLAATLDEVAARFDVALGSYPATTAEARARYASMITVEGDAAAEVAAAAEVVRARVDGRFEEVVDDGAGDGTGSG